ncbi:MAG: site-specific DNA-methyltransferase, partial [Chloroflexota bacterium]
MDKRSVSNQAYGPENPHPLSKLKAELVWEGKYDEYGNRRPLKLPLTPLPLQRIETIDEPRDRSHAQGLLFDPKKAHQDDFRNMLIWGDNKLAMAALLDQFRGTVDLIYIDPPFNVGADFTMEVQLGDEGEGLQKEQSILEAVAYRDTWGKGTDSYLHMMYEQLTLMRDLLSEKGSIFVHLAHHIGQYVKIMMDEIFGKDNFQNEIIWFYKTGGATKERLARKHDNIFFFTKSQEWIFNPQMEKSYMMHTYGFKKSDFKIDKETGLQYSMVYSRDVWDIPSVGSATSERVGFNTQKPEALLERIILSSSNEGGLVADLFSGSGTTLAVAEKLKRRWIGVDLGRYAIHTSRKRLIQVQRELNAASKPYRSFDVFNLGRYERQWWQMERLKGADTEHRQIVLQFYKATPL